MIGDGQESRPTRRSLIDWIIGVCGLISGVALLAPAAAYLWPVTRTGPIKAREEVGESGGWAAWQSKKVSVAGKPVLVIRTDKGFVALSAVCTHLGCLVAFDAGKKAVLCPCHAAAFDLQGQVTGGPPPRPLPMYSVSEAQGKVYVSS